MFTMREAVQQEKTGSQNYWVNLINFWTARDCLDYLGERGIERNPVSELIHRSGECMCGTMQSQDERKAAFWVPKAGPRGSLNSRRCVLQLVILDGVGGNVNRRTTSARKMDRWYYRGFSRCVAIASLIERENKQDSRNLEENSDGN